MGSSQKKQTERSTHDLYSFAFQALGNNMIVQQKDTTIRELQKQVVRAHSTTL